MPSETPWQCKSESSTDKIIGDNKILTGAGGAEQFQFQPSVKSVLVPLGVFAGLTASVGTKRQKRFLFGDYTCECGSRFEFKLKVVNVSSTVKQPRVVRQENRIHPHTSS